MDVTSVDPEPQQPQPGEPEHVTSTDPEPPQPDEAKDFTSVNPKLLQLQQVSPMRLHVQRMFKQWLSLPETCRKMNSLIENAMPGAPINTLGNTDSSALSSTYPAPSHGFPLNVAKDPLQSQELKNRCISRINQIFNNPLGRLLINEFKSVTRDVCKLPSFFSSALFRRIDSESTGLVTREVLIKYWVDGNMLTMNTATQIYKILKQPGREYLSQDDFEPILREILATHPSLRFIKNQPENQDAYAKTVICRIFYQNDRSASGRLILRDLKRGDLVDAMQQLDEEQNINNVRRYFSYKHAYVINAAFEELADDEDLIERDRLRRYARYSLSRRVIDRIFSEAPKKFTSNVPGKMNYQDFIYFLLAEEDKTTESSIEYWFKCLDLDGNEKITADETKYFYEEQMIRSRALKCPPAPFKDILCRIIDMIAPEREEYMTLRDFKRSKLSGNVFNMLFNVRKFLQSESAREREDRQQEVEKHPDWTEWDHFVNRNHPA
ncbi:serine/threonine protein phosphatase 2A regulatory subunit B''alpha-like [Melia azedarach]|uniref:Serine/threonine protein phosphatase 2A regulatory subunit B''alpha-like n=1 Tax=Melia azedarach TaxID=155640 RepID=A0ACC1YT91_MELAZ|nr:serine/threonine protein phosphatase 2A regulatory subunit B''alpha-like [Melia azedarach]